MRTPQGRWTDVFLAFRLSLDPRKLWLAFRGVVLSLLLVGLLLAVLAAAYHARGVRFAAFKESPPAGQRAPHVVWKRITAEAARGAPAQAVVEADTDVWGALRRGRFGQAVTATGAFATALARAACDAPVLWLHPACFDLALVVVLCELLLLLIWSYYGAAILRLLAVEYALGERIETASALAYARRKHHSFYGAPLGLVAAVLVLALCIAAVGLLAANVLVAVVFILGLPATGVAAAVVFDRSRSGWLGLAVAAGGLAAAVVLALLLARTGWPIPYVGEIAAGLLSPLAFLAGALIALIAIWLVLGTPLMFGALSSSDCDAFEAWSRSFHYLFTHPWHVLFLWLALCVYGAACMAFVFGVRLGAEWATLWPLSAGLLGRYELVYPATGGGLVVAGARGAAVLAFCLALNRLFLNLIVLSFLAVFKCAAVTILYFLLRQRADGTPITEVHLDPRDRQLIHPEPAAEPQ